MSKRGMEDFGTRRGRYLYIGMFPSNLREDQSKSDWDQLNRSGNREKSGRTLV
jgi:hypothetical protein